jgi:hypothetical protein
MRRFWLLYAAPVATIIVIVAIVSGVGPAAGLLILLGSIGAMLFVWMWLIGRNERANPIVTRVDGELRWAKRIVPIDQVTGFSTLMVSTSMRVGQTTTPGGVNATVNLGVARFSLVDGTEVDFKWAELEEQQLERLESSLEDVRPGRWRPAGELRSG